jgi:hypothetical protein
MTDPAKNAPSPPLRGVGAMASLAASLATSQALVVMAAVTQAEKVLPHVARVWVMQLFAPNALLWSLHKTRYADWPHKPTAKC